MISVNFQSYNKYVTDSLYQWDLNRKLVINGLNVSVAPVIVFANRHIDRGIVVQSKLNAGVITCDVPNALLQFPCPITASLCNVSDQEYKAYETVFIPVIARVMPADYLYSDNIPILTYESIKADLDVSLTELERVTASKADLDAERGRIDTLSARLDQAIAPGGAGVVEEYDVEMSSEVGGSVKIKTNGVHAIVDFNNVIPADLDNFSKNIPYTVGTIPSYCLPFEDIAIFTFEKYKIEIVNSDGDQLIKVTWLVDISPMNPTSAFVNNSVCYALANVWVDEIADIRIGSDGTRYNSAGDAIRSQIEYIDTDVKVINSTIDTMYDVTNEIVLESGSIINSGANVDNIKRLRSKSYISSKCRKIVAKAGFLLGLGIYNDEGYVAKTWLKEINLDLYRQEYPNAKFRIIVKSEQDYDLTSDMDCITSVGYAKSLASNDFIENLMQIFPKYTVIGDSMACGYTKIGDILVDSATARATKNNWAGYLEMRTGRTFTNVAVGGSTSKDWRDTHITTANVDTNCYLVGMGANDLRKGLAVGTIGDIASNNANNADSYYGNFDYLIRQIKEYNPKAHIFVFTIPKSEGDTVESYNNAIRYVASLYDNVHCIDLYSLYANEFTEGFIADNFINGHYVPIVYNYISKMIEKAICNYIYDNYSLFKTVPY